jgi:hypothetical protein
MDRDWIPPFVIRRCTVAVPPGQTWLISSPIGCGAEQAGGIAQPQGVGLEIF